MSSKQTLEIRLADLRKKLAALSAKESLTEDEQQEVDKLASEYQETESRHKAAIIVRRGKALYPSGCESRPATVAPAGSSRSGAGR